MSFLYTRVMGDSDMSLLSLIPKEKRRQLAEQFVDFRIGAERLETKINALLKASGNDEVRQRIDTFYAKKILEEKAKIGENGEGILS